MAAGLQGVGAIGKVSGQPMNPKNIGKITPISRDATMGPLTNGTTPPGM